MVTDVEPTLALTILNVVPLRIALATEELGAEIMEYGGVPPDKATNTVSCCVANRESIEPAIAVGAGAVGGVLPPSRQDSKSTKAIVITRIADRNCLISNNLSVYRKK
jgi:hypothetical protein